MNKRLWEQVKEQVSIVRVFADLGRPVKHGKVQCPNPTHVDRNASCGVSNSKGLFNCFACGVSGSVIDLYMLLEGVDNTKATRDLAQRYLSVRGVESNKPPPSYLKKDETIAADDSVKINKAKFYYRNSRTIAGLEKDGADPVFDYLNHRGIRLSDIERRAIASNCCYHQACYHEIDRCEYPAIICGVFGIVDKDGSEIIKFQGVQRLYIKNGKKVGSVAKLGKGKFKGGFCPVWSGVDKGSVMLPISQTKMSKIIICEGFEDALAIGKSCGNVRVFISNGINNLLTMRLPKAWRVAEVVLFMDVPRNDLSAEAVKAQSQQVMKAVQNFQKQNIKTKITYPQRGKDANEALLVNG